MGKLLEMIEAQSDGVRRTSFGPTSYAAADIVSGMARCALTGVGAGVLNLAVTGRAGSADAEGSFWIAVGLGGLLMAITNFADAAAPTIGQVGAEIAYAMEHAHSRPQIEDADEPELQRHNSVRVEQWAFDGVIPGTSQPNVQRVEQYTLPVSERQLRDFASFVMTPGRPDISEASVTRACPSIGGKVWDRFKSAMIERGHLRWKSPRSHRLGVEITRGGIALCRSVLSPTAGDGW